MIRQRVRLEENNFRQFRKNWEEIFSAWAVNRDMDWLVSISNGQALVIFYDERR